MSNTITRKDIAAAVEVSEKTVARKEKQWGLDKCIARGCVRPVCYFRAKTNKLLLGLKIISVPI